MAIRYSGDCEVRVMFVGDRFVGRMRAPKLPLFKGALTRRDVDRLVGVKSRAEPGTPESYDRAAAAFFLVSEQKHGKRLPLDRRRSQILIRRVFVSPCPLEDV